MKQLRENGRFIFLYFLFMLFPIHVCCTVLCTVNMYLISSLTWRSTMIYIYNKIPVNDCSSAGKDCFSQNTYIHIHLWLFCSKSGLLSICDTELSCNIRPSLCDQWWQASPQIPQRFAPSLHLFRFLSTCLTIYVCHFLFCFWHARTLAH